MGEDAVRAGPSPVVAFFKRHGMTLAVLFLLGVVLTLGFLARVQPARSHVFKAPGDVRYFGNDPWYHLRHTRFAVKHFPAVKRWDHGTHFPGGQRAQTPGLFDVGMAGAALIVGLGSPSDLLVQHVMAWTPAVLGVLAMLLLFLLVSALWGRWVGLLAATYLLAHPGFFLNRTMLGFADHHVAEVVLSILVIYGLWRCLQREREADPEAEARWRPALLLALPLAIFQFTWVGAPLYIVQAGAALFLFAILALARQESLYPVARGTFRYGLAFLLIVVPVSLLLPNLQMRLDFFPFIVTGGAVLALALPGWMLAMEWLKGKGLQPMALALGSVGLVFAALVVFFTATPQGQEAFRHLAGKKIEIIREHTTEVSATTLWQLGGITPFLAAAALPVALVAGWRNRERTLDLLPVGYGAVTVGLWYTTQDYGYAVPPFIALGAALATLALVQPIRKSGLWFLHAVPALAIGICLLLPILGESRMKKPWAEESTMRSLTLITDGWVEAAAWMNEHTPPLTLPIDDPVEPWPQKSSGFRYPAGTYGVMCAWDFGNFLAAAAQRPVVWSQGAAKGPAQWLLTQSEKRAVGRLINRHQEEVRYVVVDSRTLTDFFRSKIYAAGFGFDEEGRFKEEVGKFRYQGRAFPKTTFGRRFVNCMAGRMYLRNGEELSYFRLIYRSPHQSFISYKARPVGSSGMSVSRLCVPLDDEAATNHFQGVVGKSEGGDVVAHPNYGFLYDTMITSTVKVFERVPGAILRGTALPGVLIQARTQLHSRTDQAVWLHTRTVRAKEDGTYRLVLPYPTGEAPNTEVVAPAPTTLFLLPDPQPSFQLACSSGLALATTPPGMLAPMVTVGATFRTHSKTLSKDYVMERVHIDLQDVMEGRTLHRPRVRLKPVLRKSTRD